MDDQRPGASMRHRIGTRDLGILSRLNAVALFRPLVPHPEDLERFLDIIEVRYCPAGSRVLEEGTMGDEMYIINSGRVRVLKLTLYHDEYTVAFLDAESGHFFGEIALMDQDKRSATIVAEVDCELLVIRRDRFIELGDKYPRIGLLITREIAKHLCRRLRLANEDIITLFGALVQQVELEMQGEAPP